MEFNCSYDRQRGYLKVWTLWWRGKRAPLPYQQQNDKEGVVSSLLFMSKFRLKQEMAHMKLCSCFSIFLPSKKEKKVLKTCVHIWTHRWTPSTTWTTQISRMCIPHKMWYSEMHTAICFNILGKEVVALHIRTKQMTGFLDFCFSSKSGEICQINSSMIKAFNTQTM